MGTRSGGSGRHTFFFQHHFLRRPKVSAATERAHDCYCAERPSSLLIFLSGC